MYCVVSKNFSKTWYQAIPTMGEAIGKMVYLKSTGQDPTCKIVTAEECTNFHLKEISK
jgi:hypothetical protein